MRAARLLLLRRAMQSASKPNAYDVSVVVPFGDDEDVIGAAVQRLAAHLRELGLDFELLAVDEDSGDNSHAVLALLRAQVPELRVLHAPGRGRGFDTGIARAQGRILWLIQAQAAVQPMAGFARAFEQIRVGGPAAPDAAVVRGRFAVAHRTRALDVAAGLRGTGDVYYRRLARRLAARGLRLDVQLGGGAAAAPTQPPARGILGIRRIRAALLARRGGAEKNT
jgi:glycosyltransferase involved in cell wall biosynthesis